MAHVTRASASTMLDEILSNTLERDAIGFYLCPDHRAISYVELSDEDETGEEIFPGPTLTPEAFTALMACLKERCGLNPGESDFETQRNLYYRNDEGNHLFLIVFDNDEKGEGADVIICNRDLDEDSDEGPE